jgi:hypothetical protein
MGQHDLQLNMQTTFSLGSFQPVSSHMLGDRVMEHVNKQKETRPNNFKFSLWIECKKNASENCCVHSELS